ncbi:MAG: AAA family ATPase [Candidatus Sedimenticola sp. (ex Thyasira tokunagai)]
MSAKKKNRDKWEAFRMKSPTPLNLKRLLAERGIPQVRLREGLTLVDGKQPSEATVTQMLLRDIWPAKTPKSFLKKQVGDFLREHEVSDEEIKTALQIDKNPGNLRIAPLSKKRKAARAPAPVDENIPQLPETEMLSQEAKRHFNLLQDPFLDDIQGPDDVYLSGEQRYIREAMYQAAKHAGFLAVVGESGAGKTVLRKDLVDRIQRAGESITVIQPRIIDKGRLTAGAICDAIINDVSDDKPRMTLEAKARQIEKLLSGSSRAGNSHVLMIEEAHDLTIKTLKYLKRFWELEDGFKRLLAIILVGQPELKMTLDVKRNWDAREVINRCEIAELQPLNGNLGDYLALKFKRIGKQLDELFHESAYNEIRARLTRESRGQVTTMMYPLVVNNVVRRAMNIAAEVGEPKINAEIIGEVIKGV